MLHIVLDAWQKGLGASTVAAPGYCPDMTTPIPYLPGIADLVSDYDGFVLDLWGVLHDGTSLYPGVADTMSRLAAAGKSFVMLTNAPRRAWATYSGLNAGHDCRAILIVCPIVSHSSSAR